jgi:hypothetical protein
MHSTTPTEQLIQYYFQDLTVAQGLSCSGFMVVSYRIEFCSGLLVHSDINGVAGILDIDSLGLWSCWVH